MAYSAYCDTAVATKWWITGTGSAVNRLSEVMDDNPSGVEEADNLGNYQPWTTFMTETVEDAVYLIHLPLEIGDGSTATTLTSLNEMVYFDTNMFFQIKASATLNLGESVGDWSSNGSFWSVCPQTDATNYLMNGSNATLNLYASRIHNKAAACRGRFYDGILTMLNSQLSSEYDVNGHTYNEFVFEAGLSTLTLKDVYIYNCDGGGNIVTSSNTIDDLHIHACKTAIATNENVTIENIRTSNITTLEAYISGEAVANTVTLINPKNEPSTISCAHASDQLILAYTVNIHITDKDGANLSGATVNLEGSDASAYDTDMWTADSVTTDANGDITEQTVTAKKWVGTSETETDYNVFRLTVSATGYQTLVLENITIDSPVDWHLELQDLGYGGIRRNLIVIEE